MLTLSRALQSSQKPVSGAQIAGGEELSRSLYGSWDGLEGGGLAARDSVRGRDGALTAVTYVSSAVGTVWDFNGTTGVIAIPGQTEWDFGTNNFAVEAQFRYTGSATNRDIVRYDNGNTGGLWGLRMNTSNKLEALMYSANRTTNTTLTSVASLNDSQWHHVFLIRNGGGTDYLMIDGLVVASGADNPNIVGAATAKLAIGASWLQSSVAYTENWAGQIAYVRIHHPATFSITNGQAAARSPYGQFRGGIVPLLNAISSGLVAAYRMLMGAGM